MFTATLDEMDQLFTFDLIHNIGLHGGPCNQWISNDIVITANDQNIVELDFFARFGGKLFDTQKITRLDLILLASCFHHSKHAFSFV